MLFDCLGIGVGLWASVAATWKPDGQYTFGYSRVETLSGFANGELPPSPFQNLPSGQTLTPSVGTRRLLPHPHLHLYHVRGDTASHGPARDGHASTPHRIYRRSAYQPVRHVGHGRTSPPWPSPRRQSWAWARSLAQYTRAREEGERGLEDSRTSFALVVAAGDENGLTLTGGSSPHQWRSP